MDDTMKKIIYTLKGCGQCDTLVKKLQDDINNGIYDVQVCDLKSKDPKVLEICKNVMEMPDYDGFPSIYDSDGNKLG